MCVFKIFVDKKLLVGTYRLAFLTSSISLTDAFFCDRSTESLYWERFFCRKMSFIWETFSDLLAIPPPQLIARPFESHDTPVKNAGMYFVDVHASLMIINTVCLLFCVFFYFTHASSLLCTILGVIHVPWSSKRMVTLLPFLWEPRRGTCRHLPTPNSGVWCTWGRLHRASGDGR